ncbi:glycosyltransferase [Actinoplanes sp. NPDC048967]|uniref:glycosyltransferase n=1 Tax=Actinoplanes sp. NPDC048967 TaxID=3155269 RepID=UPI0033C5E373
MKVLFLLNDGFGIGGTITTTFNLGSALAERGHQVEVLSTARRRDVPHMPLHPAVRLMALVEARTDHPDYLRDDPLRGQPARFYPKADYRSDDYDRMVEQRYARYLAASDADVVIATRPGLIAYAGRFAPDRMIKIGQEHLTRLQQRRAMREELPRHLRKLDAFVTITARDAEDYRAHVRLTDTELTFIPNSVPAPVVPPSHGRDKIVVAAGRLVQGKRYDLLIRAFAAVTAERPDWQLRVYGQGKLRTELRALVAELGLHDNVLMMGPYTPIETEWAKGAIAAVPSDQEPFGMTLVEAMRCGVPVVSTDAPYGPAEILQDGMDGLLTPIGDEAALAAALLRVINDDGQREAMAAAALKNAQRYDPALIAEQYEQLFDRLAARKAGRRRWWPRRERPAPPQPVLGPAPTSAVPTVDALVTADGELMLADSADLIWWRDDDKVPAGGDLTEGTWQLRTPDGAAVRAGRLDTRALIPGTAKRVQLPYRLSDGCLGLRVWDRPVYAEIARVLIDADGLRIEGRLVGAEPAEPVLELRSTATRELPGAVTDAGFAVRIDALPAGTWQLWLRHAPGEPAVRLGRFLDDVARKDIAYVFPPITTGGVTMQPHYDANNEFSIRVTRR